jgi:GxxExxY protein
MHRRKHITYAGRTIHKRRLDLVVEAIVLLEFKALKQPNNAETNQILNYLRVFQIEVGLLLNFGMPGLFLKRFVYTNNSIS